ncbi:hypothetical protein [Paenibacillus silvisoli]|uniref:hypothetical protein n=1 Tax=Paenibacillus silvisoli TaxID=3110539 RepID=UPI0028050D22|nr:hypothetical protein [Paenibacillus silvisoli]
MRNILITVMMLVVVVLLFNGVVAQDTNGTKDQIETQGTAANTKIKTITIP